MKRTPPAVLLFFLSFFAEVNRMVDSMYGEQLRWYFFLGIFPHSMAAKPGFARRAGGGWRLVRTFDDHFPVAASCSVACGSELDYSAIDHSGWLRLVCSLFSLSLSMVASWLFSSVGGSF